MKEYDKGSTKILLIFFFSLGSTFFIFFLFLRLSGFSADSFKSIFVKEQLYTNAISEVGKQINSVTSESGEDPFVVLWPL